MGREQAYWNQRQTVGSWTGGFIYATGSPPPRNQQLPNSHLLINLALCSYHANLAHGSTSHSVRDGELEEKDTEGGDKDKVQLDDLTDIVIVLYIRMADLTFEAKVPLIPLNSTPQYKLLRHIQTCMLHVCNAIDRISCFFYSMAEIMAWRPC